jgi:hypothetical protein
VLAALPSVLAGTCRLCCSRGVGEVA